MAGIVLFENGTCETVGPNKGAVVASFSNGRLKLESESSSNMRFGYFCNASKTLSNRDDKILVAETDNMQYVGKNFGPEATAAPSMCKYMLGVFDKRTNKVRLVDASLFHLRPWSEDADEPHETSVKPKQDGEDSEQMTYSDKQARLILQFGTAKGKRMIKSRMRNQVDAKQLEIALQNMAKDSQEILAAAEEEPTDSGPTVIPPYNKDAERPEDVYQLDDLINREEMAAMAGPAMTFVNATPQTIDEWRENGKYPGYVVNQLSILPVQRDVRQQRASILMYWCYLHRLLRAGAKPNIGGVLKDAPLVVRNTLLERFTIVHGDVNDKRVHMIPRRLKDLLRSYLLVLCLMLEEFSIDFTALQRDLDLPLPQVEKCFQALGCKTARQASKDSVSGVSSKSFKATLVVPLKFPVYKPRAGRR